MTADYLPPKIEMARASYEEKNQQLTQVRAYQKAHQSQSQVQIQNLKDSVLEGKNIFEALMKASRECSLFEMSQALYEVGGQYRRNL